MNNFLNLFLPTSKRINWFSSKHIRGDGNISLQTRDSKPFKKVEVSGAIKLNVHLNSEGFSVTAISDENILPLIVTKNTDDVLRIYSEGSYTTKTQPVVNISATQLTEIASSGSGEVIITGVDQDDILISTSGSGDMTVSGKARNTRLRVSGSGSIRSEFLDTTNLDARVSGSGSAKSNARSSASLKVNGSGSIHVFGKPKMVHSKQSGSGSIHLR